MEFSEVPSMAWAVAFAKAHETGSIGRVWELARQYRNMLTNGDPDPDDHDDYWMWLNDTP